MKTFWQTLSKPIIAMAPMDGVTDFACRAMMARHGRPDVVFTEFTTATGLFYAPEKILRDFEYGNEERPIVAQIYGNIPEDFYRATHVVCELGFDGVDINMGCPSKSVTQKVCGGRLITAPDLALEIIRATRSAIEDWSRGQTLEDIKVPEKVIRVIEQMNLQRGDTARCSQKQIIPYSVKTRIGYDDVVIEKWIETLLTEHPAVISIHGRTLKQMYKGSASWDAIAKAVQIAAGSGTLILGNGDITSLQEATARILETGVDGVLIGRGSMGNPWIFRNKNLVKQAVQKKQMTDIPEPTITTEDRFALAIEHAGYYQRLRGARDFRSVRKHLVGYLSSIPDAASLRHQALQANTLEELKSILFKN